MQKAKTFRFMITTLSVLLVSLCSLFIYVGAVDSSTPPAVNILMPADGSALYASKCVICHGRNGAGTPALRAKGQPDLSSSEWHKSHSDEQIASRIRDGKGKMPGFKNKLSEDDVRALVKQVRTLRK